MLGRGWEGRELGVSKVGLIGWSKRIKGGVSRVV